MQLSSKLVSTRVLLLLCLMYFVLYIDRVNVATTAPLMQKDLGLSNLDLGLAFSVFSYPYALFQIIGGWLGDKFGARRTLGVSGLVVCVATAATGFANGLTSLSLARLALGFGEGATFPTATRAMASWTSAKDWGFAQGITHAFARIGNAVTPPLIVALIAVVSWRGSFVVLGLASLAWVAVWVWFFRDDPRQDARVTSAELALLPAIRQSAASRPVPWLPLILRMLPVTAVDFCYGWTLWLFLSWIPSFFFQNYHLDLKRSALFTAIVLFAGVVGDTLGGIASDRILKGTGDLRRARCAVIATGLTGAAVFLVPVVLVHNLPTAVICLTLAFFFTELVVAPIWAIPMDIAPGYAGTASGFMNLGFGVAGMLSPLVFGYLVDVTGSWALPFVGSVGLLILGAAMILRLRPDRPFVEESMLPRVIG
jgi:MFS family permease